MAMREGSNKPAPTTETHMESARWQLLFVLLRKVQVWAKAVSALVDVAEAGKSERKWRGERPRRAGA